MLNKKKDSSLLPRVSSVIPYVQNANGCVGLKKRTGWRSLELVVLRVGDGVAKVDEQLGKASFRGGIVAQHVGKRGVSKRFRKTLSECLASTVIVAQPKRKNQSHGSWQGGRRTYRRKHRTTCFRRRTVCVSTNPMTMLLKTVPTA